jgi:hypothetical protein
MADTEKCKVLIDKLNRLLHQRGGYVPPVSPTQTGSGKVPPELTLTSDMSLEGLTQNEILLAHTLLHRFYPQGIRDLNKENIEQLHSKIRTKINHKGNFDMLDRSDKNESNGESN